MLDRFAESREQLPLIVIEAVELLLQAQGLLGFSGGI